MDCATANTESSCNNEAPSTEGKDIDAELVQTNAETVESRAIEDEEADAREDEEGWSYEDDIAFDANNSSDVILRHPSPSPSSRISSVRTS